jgi:hypothetical protein
MKSKHKDGQKGSLIKSKPEDISKTVYKTTIAKNKEAKAKRR